MQARFPGLLPAALLVRPTMGPDRAHEGQYRGRKPSAGHRHQRDLAHDFGVADRLRAHARDRRRELGQEADAEPGGDHHLDPILALALEPGPNGEPMLAQPIGEVVAVFAVDAPEIGLAGDIADADPVLLLTAVPGPKGDAKRLAI